MIYLIVFSFSALLLYSGGKAKGLLKVLLFISGLLLPCFLAGCRDETIGVDVLTYAKWMYLAAKNTSFLSYLEIESNYAAIGWNVVSWISTRLFGNFSGYLFTIEAFCIVPVFFGLRRVCRNDEWVGMLIWLLLVYPASLNVMRQSVAMGFVFLAVSYIFDRRPIKFCWCIFAAFLFHQTALVCLLFYPLSNLAVYGESFKTFFGRWRWLAVSVFTLLAFFTCVVFGPYLVKNASIFKESYSYQVNHLGANDFSLGGLYLLLVNLLCWFVSRNDFDSSLNGFAGHNSLVTTYAFVSVGCLFTQMNIVASTLGRFGNYGYMLMPYLACFYMQNGKKFRGHLFLLIMLSAVYFLVITVFLGKSGVYPYKSIILGIY